MFIAESKLRRIIRSVIIESNDEFDSMSPFGIGSVYRDGLDENKHSWLRELYMFINERRLRSVIR